MPMSAEASSRSPKNDVAGITGADVKQSPTDHDSTPNAETLWMKHGGINTELHLSVKEVRPALPSPSPSPPPQSTSPSGLLTDCSPAEWTGRLSPAPNGRKASGSFDKPIMPASVEGKDESMPWPISKTVSSHDIPGIPEKPRSTRKVSFNKANGNEKVLKLSAAEMQELTSAPESLPMASPPLLPGAGQQLPTAPHSLDRKSSTTDVFRNEFQNYEGNGPYLQGNGMEPLIALQTFSGDLESSAPSNTSNAVNRRPISSSRAISTPPTSRVRMSSYTKVQSGQTSQKRKPMLFGPHPEPLDLNGSTFGPFPNGRSKSSMPEPLPSPTPQSMPLPPMSIPIYLQLELSSSKPSPLYIYRSSTSEQLYESSRIKFERLLNFLLLPPQLEQVLYFGSFACLDSWLYTFTILPLRFIKALAILIRWWGEVLAREGRFISGFIYHGSGRMWHRQRERAESASRSRSASRVGRPQTSTASSYQSQSVGQPETARNGTVGHIKTDIERKSRQGWGRKQRRSKPHPSSLSSKHKADLLQGAVIICSCTILMKLDASRMYHSIRGQATIKLYVIYNVLEVCDRLLSALGQDIFECLFSDETLERDVDGRSRILRPFGMFILALGYNVIHAAALFYQVITLNVAVNSFSNALLTLLLSNQFVEIKSTVFKKFEKDNLFQLTCADIVERFQLWLMLIIIALRNIVEVGGLSMVGSHDSGAADVLNTQPPMRSSSILPSSFTILPSWSGEVLSPFLVVIGSEMLVDWIKHAYISKFNSVKPAVYQRYLDVLAKDYYTSAFVNQNLIKRLGLPLIPLSCLFIRASVQTYHMFLATYLPPPIPSTATALSTTEAATSSPATTAALEHFDNIIRRAFGRSEFGIPANAVKSWWHLPTADDAIAALTMLTFFLGAYFVLLACKLVLGMVLLRFSRNRYLSMKKRENMNYDTGGKRVGGWGMVEVDDDKKRWIYEDDPDTLRGLKERERAVKDKADKGNHDFEKISRYEMAAKRIW